MPVYVVDSNFFIQAHRYTYPLDVAHSFWNKVRDLTHEQKIISIDKVRDEIYDHQDALEDWCTNNLPYDFFKDTSQTMAHYTQIATWAASKSHHFLPNAIAEFLQAGAADAYLVAFGLADPANRILVTQEVSEPKRKNKIKIPEPCIDHGVQYCNVMEMFRRLGVTF